MKKFLMAATTAMLTAYTSAAVAAPESPFFVGGFLGDSTLDIRAKSEIADLTEAPKDYSLEAGDSQTFAFLLTGGYRFTDMIGIEGQYITSIQDDKVFGGVKINEAQRENLSPLTSSISAIGVYAVFQGGEDAYFKARVGIAQSVANFETDFASASFSSTDFLSFGISIGQKLGSLGSVELTFMRYPDVHVSQQEFAKDFASTAPYHSYTSVRRDLGLEALMFGYVFQF